LRSRDRHGGCAKKAASIVVDLFVPNYAHVRITLVRRPTSSTIT
jgi:hypothetical protein